jgi:broad specificity phosphatase PhoE
MTAANTELQKVYLARHGETEWSLAHRHTSFTDLPLTPEGEENARRLRERFENINFAVVLTSPLRRARRTCELAGFGNIAVVDPDLVEWNYGDYEGRRAVEIREQRPKWNLFHDGCPGGETAEQVGVRADRVMARLRAGHGNALLFAHRHFLSVFAARWVSLAAANGGVFFLSEASVSILGYDHTLEEPVIRLWNDRHHLNQREDL